MSVNSAIQMKSLRKERRARGECANGCGNLSGKYYLCSSCRDKFRKRQTRFKLGIKKTQRDPKRLIVWDVTKGNKELISALQAKGIDFRNHGQLEQFANLIKRTPRTIQGWIFEGRVPHPSLWKQIELSLEKPIYSLFLQLSQNEVKRH